MGRNSSYPPPPDIDETGGGNGSAGSDVGFHPIRDRFPFKRNTTHLRDRSRTFSDRQLPRTSNRSHQPRFNRKGLVFLFPFKGRSGFYVMIIFAVFLFAFGFMLLQSSIASVFRQGSYRERLLMKGLKFGSTLKFVPGKISQRFLLGDGLDRMRSQPRIGIRSPRIALILGHKKNDPPSLMLVTVIKNLQKLGYVSSFEGVIVDSIEAKEAISSLMQEPFCSVPLIWIIQEDNLSSRLQVYQKMGWRPLVSHWRSAFSRASVVVFPDFTFPMLYSMLDSGNFFVIPGSPVDVWAAESYIKTHSKDKLREFTEFGKDDLLVLVVGSSIFYDDLSWDYAVAMHTLGPLLIKYAWRNDEPGPLKFLFLCGNSTDGYDDALKEVASHLGLPHGSVTHYGLNGDVNGLLLMADMVLYGSAQDVQGFPPLLIRAMTFAIPVILPDFPVLRKYVVDGVHGIFYSKHNPDSLMNAFSLLLSNGQLSEFAQDVASSGRQLAKDVLALECITGWARLLENVLNFPSDAVLPSPVSKLQQGSFEWNLFNNDLGLNSDVQEIDDDSSIGKVSIVTTLEKELASRNYTASISENETKGQMQDIPTKLDWDIVREIERSEENEFLEMEESRRAQRQRSDDVDAVVRLPLLNQAYYRDILCEMGGIRLANRVDDVHWRPWIGFQSWRAAGRQVSLSEKAEKVLEETIQQNPMGDAIYFWAHLDMDGSVIGSNNVLTFWSMCDILNGGNCRTVFEVAFRHMYALPAYAEGLPPMPEDGDYWSALHSWVMPTPSFLEFIMFSRMFIDSLDAPHINASKVNMCLLGSSGIERKHCYCRILELLINVWAYHSARKMVYIDPDSGSLEEQHQVEQRRGFTWAKFFNFTLLKSMDENLAEAADDGDHPRDRWLWPLTGEVYWQGIYEKEREERYRLKMDKKRKKKREII